MKVTDGFGNPGGFRPGYVFASNSDLADEATKAYEERNQRLSNSWRTKGDHNEQQSDNTRDAAPRTRRSLGEAQKLVDDAYAQKVARLDYRHRRHAT